MNTDPNNMNDFTNAAYGEIPSSVGVIENSDVPQTMVLPPSHCGANTTNVTPGKETNFPVQFIDINGNPIPNVNIKALGTTKGSITDQDGYAIMPDVPPQTMIEATHVGKKTVKRTLENFGDLITMQDAAIQGDAVVLTTQEKAKRSLKWGAIAAIAIVGLSILSGSKKKKRKPKVGLAGTKSKKKKKQKKQVTVKI